MKVQQKKWIRFRIYMVAAFFISGLGIIVFRSYQLQILERERLSAIARAGYRDIIKLPPKRGTVYDREKHELAVSIEVKSVFAHPKQIEKKSAAASRLAGALHLERNRVRKLLGRKSSFVWIKRRISPKEVRQVEALKIKGVGFKTENKRYYPGKEIAGHLMGFSGDDNQGLEGLERSYERYLKGPQYALVQMRDALGRPFFVSRPTPDEGHEQDRRMHSLVLTIDKDIQYKVQQSLAWAVKKWKAKSGQCVVVNPNTGEILAMAVAPSFNPNIFRKYRPYQWRNRVITDVYEPGSTMKAFLLATALENHTVSPTTKFECENGAFEVANHVIHDTHKYGDLSVSDIVVYSSNIGAVKIGLKLGYDNFHQALKSFGFGSRSGIDLLGERSGFIRPVKKARTIDRANAYFGQGLTVTSLQLAMAMAAIANGGKLMRPYVVKAITDQNGEVVKQSHPKVVRRVMRTETAEKVKEILTGVVSKRGTAPMAAINGYRAAGKTGTSQKVDPKTKRYSRRDYVSIFVGFVPVHRPKLVIMVMLDEPRGNVYGGIVSAPVFSEVGGWVLNYLQINPRFRTAKAVEPPILISKDSDVIKKVEAVSRKLFEDESLLPDFRGKSLREVLSGGRSLGLKVIPEGTGLAVRQSPRPGAPLKGITTLNVLFKAPL